MRYVLSTAKVVDWQLWKWRYFLAYLATLWVIRDISPDNPVAIGAIGTIFATFCGAAALAKRRKVQAPVPLEGPQADAQAL